VEVYRDQVRQFSKTIVQLEKNLTDEQEKRFKIQAELDNIGKNGKASRSSPSTPPISVETVIPVMPVLTASVADIRLVCNLICLLRTFGD
jgi:hypothetical protein